MVICFVPECMHCSESKQCKFRAFPREDRLKKKWINSIRRKDREPSIYSLVCSCHFVNNDFNKLPTLFKRNEKKVFQFVSPEKRKRRTLNLDACISSESTEPTDEITNRNKVDDISVTTHETRRHVYEAEIYFKDKEIENLKEEIKKLTIQPFGLFAINDDTCCRHYTGLCRSKFNILKELCMLLPLKHKYKPVRRITFEDSLLLTLMKLRQNFPLQDLGYRFGIAKSTVSNIIHTYLPILHKVVFVALMDEVPTQRKAQTSLPPSFSELGDCRITLDCTEMRSEVPKSMTRQKMTYSPYKKYTTVKILLGVAPNGAVIWCSFAYPGSISDKEIVKHCGILNIFQIGDMILADKGFLIADLLPKGVSVNIPPFLSEAQFSKKEVIETRNIARARVHVERANQRLKIYRILNLIPHSLLPKISMVIQTCAGLTNFQSPLFKCLEKDFSLSSDSVEFVEV